MSDGSHYVSWDKAGILRDEMGNVYMKSKELVHVACYQPSLEISPIILHITQVVRKWQGSLIQSGFLFWGYFVTSFFLYIILMGMVIRYNCEICYLVLLLAANSPCFFQVFLRYSYFLIDYSFTCKGFHFGFVVVSSITSIGSFSILSSVDICCYTPWITPSNSVCL